MTKKPIIVFDLGAVLIDWDPRYLYRKLFEGDNEEMEFFLETICPLEWNAKMDAGLSFEEAVAERSQLYPEYKEFIMAYYQRWEEMLGGAIQGTVNILAELRKRGFYLCALSNWSAETFPLTRKHYAFLDWFQEIVLSGDVKFTKPNPVMYGTLLERIKQPATNCLFIDDSHANIAEANDLGFDTILFTSPENLQVELLKRGILKPPVP
ncbi:MAG: HAD family phosphatase [Anaerolineaceae bacterium]|nr:HAD family phosphatase [Anaerolineaceae bacterium]